MPLDALPARFLFRLEAKTSAPISIEQGPRGTRLLVPVESGTVSGPAIKGDLIPGLCSEYATLCGDGSLRADVRLTIESDDGVHLIMTYQGVGTTRDGTLRVHTAPTFEVGDERYAWLNQVQAVGLGSPVDGGIAYDVYAIEV